MTTLAFLQNLSSWEIVLIFLVVLLFFGAKRLPELFRSLGKSVREFKDATSGIEEDIRAAMDTDEKPKSESAKASSPAVTTDADAADDAAPATKVATDTMTETDTDVSGKTGADEPEKRT